MTTKPNILLIMADQMNIRFTPLMDGPAIMPNLQQIADSGMTFQNCYCNNPLCAPSRASMLAGRLVSSMGCAWGNGSEFSSEIPTMVNMLRHAGYRTVLSGKMHFIGPDQLHGFEERVTTDVYPADFSWNPGCWNSKTPTHERMREYFFPKGGASEWNRQIDYDEHVHAEALRTIKNHRGDRPLFLTVSYTHPHNPYAAQEKYIRRYGHVAIPMPDAVDFSSLDDYNKHVRWDNGFTVPPEESVIHDARRAYCAMLSYVDDKIGEIQEALTACAMNENTLVIVTSDHGDMLGEKGMWDKRTYFEDSVRVPLIISGPGVSRGITTSNVSLVDLFPTLVDAAASTWDCSLLEGRSVMETLHGAIQTDAPVFIEYMDECIPYPFRAVVFLRKKYVHFPLCPEKDICFDMDADPMETTCIIGHERFTEIKKMYEQVTKRCDDDTMIRRVAESMRNATAIRSSLTKGSPDWNYSPPYHADRRYVR